MRSNLPLAAFVVTLGAVACLGWLYAGQIDDAPGAGLIGILTLVSSLVVAFRLAKTRAARS